MTYTNIVTALKRHYSPAPSEIVQRFHFHNCKQNQVKAFPTTLLSLDDCLFIVLSVGDQLEAMLCDHIVCGVLNGVLQHCLLAELKLTFKEAEERAILNTHLLCPQQHESPPGEDVLYIAHNPAFKKTSQAEQPKNDRPCYRYGGQHNPQTCKFSTAVCHYCKKGGTQNIRDRSGTCTKRLTLGRNSCCQLIRC